MNNQDKRPLSELLKEMEASLNAAHEHFQTALNILKPPVMTKHDGTATYSTIDDLIAGR